MSNQNEENNSFSFYIWYLSFGVIFQITSYPGQAFFNYSFFNVFSHIVVWPAILVWNNPKIMMILIVTIILDNIVRNLK